MINIYSDLHPTVRLVPRHRDTTRRSCLPLELPAPLSSILKGNPSWSRFTCSLNNKKIILRARSLSREDPRTTVFNTGKAKKPRTSPRKGHGSFTNRFEFLLSQINRYHASAPVPFKYGQVFIPLLFRRAGKLVVLEEDGRITKHTSPALRKGEVPTKADLKKRAQIERHRSERNIVSSIQ